VPVRIEVEKGITSPQNEIAKGHFVEEDEDKDRQKGEWPVASGRISPFF
jgi:hypothetical protein